MMYQSLLNRADLYPVLRKLDEEMAEEAHKRGCPCGGRLDRACYPRKPRGAPPEVEGDKDYRQRLSFCCATEGCRRRTTPPSALFMGRKIYLGAVVVLISVLRQGPTPARLARLQECVGVSARTVKRWREWWLSSFVRSDCWKAAQGLLRAPLDENQLPLCLWEAFEAKEETLKLVLLLRFIRPLTSLSAPASSSF